MPANTHCIIFSADLAGSQFPIFGAGELPWAMALLLRAAAVELHASSFVDPLMQATSPSSSPVACININRCCPFQTPAPSNRLLPYNPLTMQALAPAPEAPSFRPCCR